MTAGAAGGLGGVDGVGGVDGADSPERTDADVDRAALAVGLAQRLRAAGVDVGLTAVEAFARSLDLPQTRGDRTALYWSARVTLLRRRRDQDAFDVVFDEVFGTGRHPRRPPTAGEVTGVAAGTARAQPSGQDTPTVDLPWSTPTTLGAPRPQAGGTDERQRPDLPVRRPSPAQAWADTPFPELDPGDLARLGSWLEESLTRWPTRRTRRRRAHAGGRRVDLRATMSAARRTGWEPVRLVRSRPVRRPRRVVMVCDVSQSMQPYAAAYLHLMRAAAVHRQAEVFAFATDLTRLTTVLGHRSAERAVEQANDQVRDRFGGTRIAANLSALMRSRHGHTLRGAVVIIASDGWDSGEPVDLGRAMARLRLRAHRVVWLNPRVAAPGFEPLVGAMAAAWPYCDVVLPAHTMAALADVVEAVSSTR